MATQQQQPHNQGSDIPDPYEALGISRTATVDEIRRSYKQKVLETHPDKLSPTASEGEKELAQELFRQVQEAFEVLNDPVKRRAYDIHRRPLPQQTPVRADSRASTLSRTTISVPTSTPTAAPAQTYTPPRASKLIPSRLERAHSGTVVVLEQLDEAQACRMKERSEWASKVEERRLDKLKAYTASEEIQNLGQKQAALVDRMIQDLFALTPEWEIRRMKARAYKASRASARAH
ncbi:DnaJ-domain-containing protein [Thelephora ganbajun]|uniref:DnaJ-domain-containing protein n=1 Tax=Thelephora ganbajun TaxID=370292 RepID=A0ACB6Z7T9_THEGA|nr:DnaJ-domain-containing protein [Thelephora ganbajun]